MCNKKTLHNRILLSTGINSTHCYQCGKCSASCPVAEEMDFTSNTIVRMLQIEEEQADKQLLCSQAIWLCISCKMCMDRCPMGINIPEIIDYLRRCSLKKHLQHKKTNRNIIPFYYSFLSSIKHTGRLYEIGLIFSYKLKTFHWLQDLNLVPHMLLKRKLPLLPKFIKKKQSLLISFNKTKRYDFNRILSRLFS